MAREGQGEPGEPGEVELKVRQGQQEVLLVGQEAQEARVLLD